MLDDVAEEIRGYLKNIWQVTLIYKELHVTKISLDIFLTQVYSAKIPTLKHWRCSHASLFSALYTVLLKNYSFAVEFYMVSHWLECIVWTYICSSVYTTHIFSLSRENIRFFNLLLRLFFIFTVGIWKLPCLWLNWKKGVHKNNC